MKVDCTVYDLSEGKIHLSVEVISVELDCEEKAHDEAGIAAAERGCRYVTEIVVGVHE